MALPSNIRFGTVTGTFVRGVADSTSDSDRDPEAIPITDLTIRFTPSISPAIVRDTTSSPPVTLLLDPVICAVNSAGTLVGPDGAAGVELVATTGTALVPSGWTWTVTVSSQTFPQLSFSFSLDPGATVDLATVLQVPSSPGATLDAWLQAVAQAQAAVAQAQAAAASVPSAASLAATYQTLAQGLLAWTLAQAFTVTSATRDANEAITTASVVWPDGATGTFTTDTASTSFPGAIDAYHVTHVLGGVTLTVTQTAVTRDAGGAVTAQPALTVA